MVDVRCEADGAIADSQRKFELLQTQYNQEVNMANAESTLAYKLQVCVSVFRCLVRCLANSCFIHLFLYVLHLTFLILEEFNVHRSALCGLL